MALFLFGASIFTNKTDRPFFRTVCLFWVVLCYLFRDCSAWANICASTALGADFGVNRIVFAFRNSAHRAFIFASTACDAVGGNYVSHNCIILFISILVVLNSASFPVFDKYALQNCGAKVRQIFDIPKNGDVFFNLSFCFNNFFRFIF